MTNDEMAQKAQAIGRELVFLTSQYQARAEIAIASAKIGASSLEIEQNRAAAVAAYEAWLDRGISFGQQLREWCR